MRRLIISRFLGGLFIVGVCMFAVPAQAALNPGQANAIVLLLVSFGADDATIANVWRALGGSTGAVSTNTGSLSFIEATRPDNESIFPGATAVPFTTFAVTNGTNAPATIYSVTVEQAGQGKDTNVESVMVVGANTATSTPKPLSGSQVDLDSAITLSPWQSITLTVAANISPRARAGQTVRLEVVAINASVPTKGDLPVLGSARSIKRSR